jgi:hypothetical protein
VLAIMTPPISSAASSRLTVSFNSPQHGFMSMGLKVGEHEFVTAMAAAPHDSLADLLTSLLAIAQGERLSTVQWNAEPEQFDFNFTRIDQVVELAIARYPDRRRAVAAAKTVFNFKGSVADVCEPFLCTLENLLRDIETDEFDKNWLRAFPRERLAEVAKQVRGSYSQ